MSASQECAAAVIAQLAAQGVGEIVVAPGSRSAPLALAAAAAEKAGLIRLHVRIDERGAGFLALGLGKASGRPAAVVTTSGTAAGNLLPAVMEAAHSGVPLIAITADRPASLAGFGANQTTVQPGLFGGFVRWAAQVEERADPASWTAQSARAALAAQGLLGTLPGPVQLDVHLGLPLVGDGPVALPEVVARRHAGKGAPVVLRLPAGPRTVAVCGDATPACGRRVAAMAARTHTPLIAETSSNARIAPAMGTAALDMDARLAGEIERVVVFGHPTLARGVSALLGRGDVEIVVEGSAAGWPDAGWRAVCFADQVELPDGDPGWWGRWQGAWGEGDPGTVRSAQVIDVTDPENEAGGTVPIAGKMSFLSGNGSGDSGGGDGSSGGSASTSPRLQSLRHSEQAPCALTSVASDLVSLDDRLGRLGQTNRPRSLGGPELARLVLASLGSDDVLVVGSSNPVRDLDLAPIGETAPVVYANRGLAGIDGTVSTAMGIALASGAPTTLYCGDLTFLHDLTGLVTGPDEPCPDLRIVVADDAGGSIFATLPEYAAPAFADVFERVFTTPTLARPAALARALGLPVREAITAEDVVDALRRPVAGIDVVVARVEKR